MWADNVTLRQIVPRDPVFIYLLVNTHTASHFSNFFNEGSLFPPCLPLGYQQHSLCRRRNRYVLRILAHPSSRISWHRRLPNTPRPLQTARDNAVANVETAGGTVGHRYNSSLKGFSCCIPESLYSIFNDDPSISYVEKDSIVYACWKKWLG
ncbi:hypothetical protein BC938DRAFT_479107 [Jimgerdemannia flammicorona]|uniref:Uncharacterized protein n=1 Tax=Jimgerdemannia flammicorona TaxID=994334 RepID=A0A433QLJ1_9FUNG|nr:hypothetical protein BC938DRAFT_479107 [Jimgerdemannia flammicorona]